MIKLLDIKIDELDFQEAMRKIAGFLEEDKVHQICTVNPEFLVAARKDKEFKEVLNSSDLNVPDGFGLKIGSFFKGQKITERITGVDLAWEICKMAADRGKSVYFLGAKEGIAEKAAHRIKQLNPNLKIAGTYAGNPAEEGIVNKINETHPDILLVAFGAPKQDKFIYNNRETLKVKVAMGIGGTLDYIAGNVQRAPKWIRACGLEWLYRLIRQPRRIVRILTAVFVFPILVLFSTRG